MNPLINLSRAVADRIARERRKTKTPYSVPKEKGHRVLDIPVPLGDARMINVTFAGNTKVAQVYNQCDTRRNYVWLCRKRLYPRMPLCIDFWALSACLS